VLSQEGDLLGQPLGGGSQGGSVDPGASREGRLKPGGHLAERFEAIHGAQGLQGSFPVRLPVRAGH
jgi:hypothetical protein